VDSKTLDVHHALWRRGAVILEGLDLAAVPCGDYQLCALPLKVVGLDGAPVRAILIEP
jgi:arylformamidase